ncbi:MAG: response regulator [candidate division Zixibacteria bacterium]|nr:response regulator [candidate division Zixibacteria bacterium]
MITDAETRPIEILLVEDNPGDVRLTQEALKDSKIFNNLNIVNDGDQAMDFLLKKDKYHQSPTPDIILLDLNLPKKDGRQVLEEIKANHDLMKIPVVILTTSHAEEDIINTYNLHANCYVTKPVDLNQFIKVVKSIEDFWFTIVRLPVGHSTAVGS